MLNRKKILVILSSFILIFGLIFTIYLSLQPKGVFDTRKKAAEIEQKPIFPFSTPTIIIVSTPSAIPYLQGPKIKLHLTLEGRNNNSTSASIYGIALNQNEELNLKNFKSNIAKINKLGSVNTDTQGMGQLSLQPSYFGKKLYLFASTTSHLRKWAAEPIVLETEEGSNKDSRYFEFGTLFAGDVYLSTNGLKDDIIDIYDKGALLNAIKEFSAKGVYIEKMDLNGDKLIDASDLSILSKNLGKQGEIYPPSIK